MCEYCENPANFDRVIVKDAFIYDPKIEKQSRWDERYMEMAGQIAQWSKDTTKIGAVAVGRHGQILSTGYNGFPRKHFDYPGLYENREEKYKRIIHAEMNVIYNASLTGISLENSTLYVHGLPPCSNCTLGIVQVGIARVVVRQIDIDKGERWKESWELAKQFLNDARVVVEII